MRLLYPYKSAYLNFLRSIKRDMPYLHVKGPRQPDSNLNQHGKRPLTGLQTPPASRLAPSLLASKDRTDDPNSFT